MLYEDSYITPVTNLKAINRIKIIKLIGCILSISDYTPLHEPQKECCMKKQLYNTCNNSNQIKMIKLIGCILL